MSKSKRGSTSRKSKAARPAARAPKAKAKPSRNGRPAISEAMKFFDQAIAFAGTGFFIDAINAFKKAATLDPRNDLADDATYNVGLCYLQLKLYDEALAYFTRVIKEYPKATINAFPGAQEFGKTAAKAHYGRVHAYLALGRRDEAQKELESLNQYPDSYVVDPQGSKKTYYELALEALK